MTAEEVATARAELFANVFVLVQRLTNLTDAALSDWGLTSRQWLLLAILTRGFPDRAPSLTEAAARYGSSRQNVKQIALALEARGFLRLAPDGRDGRTTRLVLTDKVRMFDEPEGEARGRALLADAFGSLEDADILELRSLVLRWIETLDADRARPGRG
jgi:DNA-binding MarR family transcriptional regulator